MTAVAPDESAAGERRLVRALGTRALAATIFNITVGGGIFLLPAIAADGVGPVAAVAYLACAAAMGLIVLCFAEAGSRVTLTGGPYAYVETVFGPYVGFLTGVLLWLATAFAVASVANAFADSAAAAWPALGAPPARATLLVVVFAGLAALNVRGTQHGARLIEVATIAKLLPLVGFVVVGAFFIRPANLTSGPLPTAGDFTRTAMLLVFVFAGIESALVPGGEVRDPARTVPRALGIAMLGVTLLYVAIQLVAQGVLGDALAGERNAPLAAAASAAIGPAGTAVMLGGAIVSMFGYLAGMAFAMPRALYAFARDGLLPASVASIHPRFQTPHVAIIVQTAIVVLLAVTGSFAALAVLANVSLLLLYLLCCVAAWELRRRDVRLGGIPFRVPGGPLVPVLAVLLILWLLSGATAREHVVVGGVLVAASLLFLVRRRHVRPPTLPPDDAPLPGAA